MKRREPVIEIIDEQTAEVLRKMTPVERLSMAERMWESARVMLRGAICQEHPEWTEQQVNEEIARRISHGAVDPGSAADFLRRESTPKAIDVAVKFSRARE